MDKCVGCYVPVPEGEVFCKTCADRRKPAREVKLSDPNALAPSQDFEGFSGPMGEREPDRIVGGFRDKPELDPEARLRWIVQGGLRRVEDSSAKAD